LQQQVKVISRKKKTQKTEGIGEEKTTEALSANGARTVKFHGKHGETGGKKGPQEKGRTTPQTKKKHKTPNSRGNRAHQLTKKTIAPNRPRKQKRGGEIPNSSPKPPEKKGGGSNFRVPRPNTPKKGRTGLVCKRGEKLSLPVKTRKEQNPKKGQRSRGKTPSPGGKRSKKFKTRHNGSESMRGNEGKKTWNVTQQHA